MPSDESARLHLVSAHFNLLPYHAARYDGFLQRHAERHCLTSLLMRPTKEYQLFDQRHSQANLFQVVRIDTAAHREKRALRAAIHRALAELKPDVILLPGGYAEFETQCVIEFAAKSAIPLVLCSATKADDSRRQWWREFVKKSLVAHFSAFLVGGTPQRDYLVKLGAHEELAAMGYDAVDNNYFAAEAAKVRSQLPVVRGQLGLPEQYFLVSARLVEVKNLPRLLQAYARYRHLAAETLKNRTTETPAARTEVASSHIQTSTIPWNLVLLGDGPLRSELCDLVSDLSLQESVHLPGFKQYNEVAPYYALAGALILPSLNETWGLVVNEAMSCGLPVLVSKRCGCARDLVENGVNGFTFEPYDVEGMAQLMLKISAMDTGSSPAPDADCRALAENPSESEECVTSASQSGFAPQPSTTLAEMGAASRRIIADWGPDRFASGLKQAVDCALRVGPIKPTLMQRVILAALLRR